MEVYTCKESFLNNSISLASGIHLLATSTNYNSLFQI
jgi:hypothetical protein